MDIQYSMGSKTTEHLLDVLQTLMARIALGMPIEESLTEIVFELQALIDMPDTHASIMLIDGDLLRLKAAPTLPQSLSAEINEMVASQDACSFGEAVSTGVRVFSHNISTDPNWKELKDVVGQTGLCTCWSFPIISSYGSVLGTLDVYFGHEQKQESRVVRLVERFCLLASVVIERELNESKSRALREALQNNNNRFEAFARAMPDLVIILDEHGNYVDIYGGEMDTLILPADLLKGRNLSDVLPPAKSDAMLKAIHNCLDDKKRVIYEYVLDVQSGHRAFEARISPIIGYDPAQPELRHVIWVARDVSEQKRAHSTIRKLSFYDAVTSLPNRRLLNDRLDTQSRKAVEQGVYGAILYIDLNDFKRVNDTLGISGGDEIIVKVSRRIASVLGLRDSLARVGGDDFVILLDYMQEDLEQFSGMVTTLATKILNVFEELFTVKNKQIRVNATIGINTFGDTIEKPETLVSYAESAMYRAKELGEKVLFFDIGVQEKLRDRIQLEFELEQALKDGEISVFYQPQVDVQGRVVGAEALMRWHHPVRGFVSPEKCIPLAEQLGIIPRLQALVLRNAGKLIAALEKDATVDSAFRVAVNISAFQFMKADFESAILEVLDLSNTLPNRFILEITEGVLLTDVDLAIAQIERLRVQGFEVSIDDFGTGYSSLSYLQKLPVDEVKIDRSFIKHALEDETGHNIVSAIIYLARQLGFRVVAEGVETNEQFNYLIEQGADLLQGYYIAKPMAEDDCLQWLRSRADNS